MDEAYPPSEAIEFRVTDNMLRFERRRGGGLWVTLRDRGGGRSMFMSLSPDEAGELATWITGASDRPGDGEE